MRYDWCTAANVREMNRLAEERAMELHYEHIARLSMQHGSVDADYRIVKAEPSKPQPTNLTGNEE